MFDGKIIVITGGSSGLGKELAGRLIKRGASLALVARNEDKLLSVKEELLKSKNGNPKVEIFSCDVADYTAAEKTMKNIADSVGNPDILINSAGILRESYFEKQTIETFREVMDINYFGTLNCIKAVLPFFKMKGGGRIVNICSMAGLMGVFGYAAYCSSKHALNGLTDTLRSELKPQNIIVQIAYPPEFDSPMVDELNTYRTTENRTLVHTGGVMKVEAVTDEIIKGIEKEKYQIIPGALTRALQSSNRLFPSLGRAIMDSRIRKVYRGPAD